MRNSRFLPVFAIFTALAISQPVCASATGNWLDKLKSGLSWQPRPAPLRPTDLSYQFPREFKNQGNFGTCYFYGYVAGVEAAINRFYKPRSPIAIDEQAALLTIENRITGPDSSHASMDGSVMKNHFVANALALIRDGKVAGGDFDLLAAAPINFFTQPLLLAGLPLFTSGAYTGSALLRQTRTAVNSIMLRDWKSDWNRADPFALIAQVEFLKKFNDIHNVTRTTLLRLQQSTKPIPVSLNWLKVIEVPVGGRGCSSLDAMHFIADSLSKSVPLVTGLDISGLEYAGSLSSNDFKMILPGSDHAPMNHMMVLIGAKRYAGRPYFVFRNSWGASAGIVRMPISEMDRITDLEIFLNPKDDAPTTKCFSQAASAIDYR